jgi:hypothetical protein
MGAVLKVVLTKLFSEKVLTWLLVKLGDYLVAKSTNKLDDTLWSEVKKVLNK